MHLMRSVPTSATTTRQEYDVYKLHNTPGSATPESYDRMVKFYRKVVDEDFELCEQVQKNLARGVFASGLLHPFHEEGVHAFQGMVVSALNQHLEAEDVVGREIWAARPTYARQGTDGSGDLAENARDGARRGGVNDQHPCVALLDCYKAKLKDVDW